MDFEDILKDVGGFGLYQKLLVVCFLVPAFVVIPWFSMNTVFISNSPDHWCRVPALVGSNLTAGERRALVGPPGDPSCSMYDVDYGGVLASGNRTADPTWPVKKCDSGWEYDDSDYDATSVTRWNMVCGDAHYASLFQSLIFIGDVVGTPIYGYMSDKWGRKPTFLFLAFLIAASELGSVLSPNFVVFLLMRAVNGSSMSTVYSVGYIILLELVSPDLRTRMNGVSTTSWTLGLCLLPLLAYLTHNWIRLSIVTSSAAACLLLYWKILPESPSWLISQERYEEAAEIMTRISKTNKKTAHEGGQLLQRIQRLGERMKKQKMGETQHSPLDFFKYPLLRKRFLLVTICWVGNSLPYFGLQFNVKNLGGSVFFNFFLMSLIEIPSHFATWIFMERVGRRWCSVAAFALSTASCLLPVFAPPGNVTAGVVASLLAKAGTSSAFMTLYQQGPELFPTALRGVGLGMACTIGTGSTLVVPYIVYLAKYGSYIPFLVFAVLTLLTGVCAAFLPETLNKKLPQTVEDAENFQRDMKFFSCRAGDDDDEGTHDAEQSTRTNSWFPRTLSAVDIASTVGDSCASGGKRSTSDSSISKRNCASVDVKTLETP